MDVPAICLLCALFYLFELSDWIEPRHTPLNCADLNALSWPYWARQTITDNQLIIATFALPMIFLFVSESLVNMQAHARLAYTSDSVLSAMFDLRRFTCTSLLTMYRFLAYFISGYGCTTVFTDTMKLLLGQMRPHFLAVCQPDWAAMGQLCGEPTNWSTMIIENVICTGKNERAIRQARLSLPSGHASLSAFAGIYLCVYLHWRFARVVGAQITLFIAESFIVISAVMISLSRVADNYHRYADVLAGLIIGVIIATLTMVWLYESESRNERAHAAAAAARPDVLEPRDRALEESRVGDNNDAESTSASGIMHHGHSSQVPLVTQFDLVDDYRVN